MDHFVTFKYRMAIFKISFLFQYCAIKLRVIYIKDLQVFQILNLVLQNENFIFLIKRNSIF